MRQTQLFWCVLVVIAMALFGVGNAMAQGGGDSPFSGNLDRPTSTWNAADNEGDIAGDDDENPDDPPDDEEEDDDPPDFMGEEIEGSTIVLVLDASGSMYAGYDPGYPVYNGSGNVIAYPNRWQTTQSEAAQAVQGMDEDNDFDIVVYDTYVRACFGALTTATGQAKGAAVSWIYSTQATGCTNSYDGLKLAFTNYGPVDTIMFMSDGYPNTALSRGIGACAGYSTVQNMILSDCAAWVATMVAANPGFSFMVIQVGGYTMPFMTQLGSLQNSSFVQK